MPSFFGLYVQHQAWDVTEVAELRVEVTRARVTTIMAGTRTSQTERMAQGRAVLLATASDETSVVD
jgi:hypothetical protein